MLRGRSVLAGVPQHRKRFLLPPHTPSPFCAAGSTVSLRRSSSQVRDAPRHSWQARGDDACTAPRLASPAFASSTSPVLAPQIRHGLQTGSSSFLGAAAGEALGYRLTLLNFKVRGQLLLLDLCSELAESDAFGAPPLSRTCTCTVPQPGSRSRVSLIVHPSCSHYPLPLRRRRALTSRRSTLRPTTTDHACLPPRHRVAREKGSLLCERVGVSVPGPLSAPHQRPPCIPLVSRLE